MNPQRSIPITLLVTAAWSCVAWALDPLPGTYLSHDLGGDLDLGRASQSWELPSNGLHGAGDVLYAYALNPAPGPSKCGMPPCDQWIIHCAVQPTTQAVADARDGAGTGLVVLTNTFEGGTFFLHRLGPWGDGVNHLTGVLGTMREVVTIDYFEGVARESLLAVDASGQFDGSACLLSFVVTEGVGRGDSDALPWPTGYPLPYDADCVSAREYGAWADWGRITLDIECPTPARPATWGATKVRYH